MAKKGDLTERQREFARLIVSGERQVIAYRKAFDCNGKSEAAVRADASRLARNANIIKLIAKLRERADFAAVMTWERRMELLSEQAEAEAKKGNWNGLIRIVDILNKMDGTYETKKREAELEKAAKEEERKKAAKEEGQMSVEEIVKVLTKGDCGPEDHPYTCDNPPRSPEITMNNGIAETTAERREI